MILIEQFVLYLVHILFLSMFLYRLGKHIQLSKINVCYINNMEKFSNICKGIWNIILNFTQNCITIHVIFSFNCYATQRTKTFLNIIISKIRQGFWKVHTMVIVFIKTSFYISNFQFCEHSVGGKRHIVLLSGVRWAQFGMPNFLLHYRV